MPVSDRFDLGIGRDGGLTHVLDKGLGPRAWEDVLETAGDYIDIVKLGWGTAWVTGNLERKLEVLREKHVGHRPLAEALQDPVPARDDVLAHVVRTYFGDSPEQAVTALLRMSDVDIDDAEVARLRNTIRRARQSGR